MIGPLLFIAGPAGSGKSTVAKILSRHFDQRVANVGDLLLKRLQEVGVGVGLRAEIGPKFLNNFGVLEIFQVVDVAIQENAANVFDGVRLAETCQLILRNYRQAVIWLIRSAPAIRLRRLHEKFNEELGVSSNADEAIAKSSIYDQEEAAIEKLAHVVIDNDGSLAQLHETIAFEFSKLQ